MLVPRTLDDLTLRRMLSHCSFENDAAENAVGVLHGRTRWGHPEARKLLQEVLTDPAAHAEITVGWVFDRIPIPQIGIMPVGMR